MKAKCGSLRLNSALMQMRVIVFSSFIFSGTPEPMKRNLKGFNKGIMSIYAYKTFQQNHILCILLNLTQE